MAIPVRDDGKTFERPTSGIHAAVCAFVEDIGIHVNKTYGKQQAKIVVIWEIDQKIKDGDYAGKPFMVSKRYTKSLNEKAHLTKDLEGWMGHKLTEEKRKEGVDLEKFKGLRCTLNLVENGEYINVGAVMPAQENNNLKPVCTECPKWVEKLRAMSVDPNESGAEEDPPTDGLPF